MIELIATEDAIAPTGLIGGLVGASSGISFALWYGWYVTTKTIPKLVSDFREERILDREDRKSERDEFKSALKAIVTTIEMGPCRAVHEEMRRRESQGQHETSKLQPQPMSLQPHGGV